MSFIVQNPLSATTLNTSPPTPPAGTRGLFPKEDGWYDIDDKGVEKKLGSGGGEGSTVTIDQKFNPDSENAQSGKAVEEALEPVRANIELLNVVLNNKADKADTYSKAEIDNKLSDIDIPETDLSDYYTKDEVDNKIENIDIPDVDLSNYYTKNETYNKVEIDSITGDIETALDAKADKTAYVSFADGETIALSDNTAYVAEGEISTLTIEYPETDFICSLEFTTKEEGDITIILPQSKYIGEVPTFKNGEIWELSIKNGIVIGGLAI